ncbi:hypothetical protein H6789_00445 [Candidatus Nomurabacteria bacterium]|nr:hypothetical protein [Candidatus Nomurabacteria bacterium]
MRKLMRVTAVCLAVCIVGLFFKSEQPIVDNQEDEIALLIGEHDDLMVLPPVELEPLEKDPDLELLKDIVANEMLRLKVFKGGYENKYQETIKFIEFVKLIESSGNRYAKAETSTAMSFFQFTIPSVSTAVNRLGNYMARHCLGELPVWAQELRDEPTQLFEVTELRQAILTLVNIVEQRGSDELLVQFLGGERSAAKAIYYAHHHTDPDEATLKRTEQIFAKIFN